jgi:hypothetical protein
MLDVLVRPYPERTAGTPVRYGYDPDKKRFWLHYRPEKNAVDSTVIHLPQRIYPEGWTFGRHAPAGGSWRWEENSRRLYLAPGQTTGLQKVEILPLL